MGAIKAAFRTTASRLSSLTQFSARSAMKGARFVKWTENASTASPPINSTSKRASAMPLTAPSLSTAALAPACPAPHLAEPVSPLLFALLASKTAQARPIC